MQDYKRRRKPPRRRKSKRHGREGSQPRAKVLSGGLESLPRPSRRPSALAGLGRVLGAIRGPPSGTDLARWRRLAKPVTVFALVAAWLLVGIVHGVVGAWQAPLDDLRITGLSRLTPERIAAAAHLSPGMRVGDLDPYATAEGVLRLSGVKGVDVRRYLPGRLVIAVEERFGAALVLLADGSAVLIDGEGVVLETNLPAETVRRSPLPRVKTTVRFAEAGRTIADAGLTLGLTLLARAESLGLAKEERLTLDASRPHTVRISLPLRNHRVVLPWDDADRALGAYAALEGLLEKGTAEPLTVDMRAVFRRGPGWIAVSR